MNSILYYTRRYKDHIFVYILVWLFFTLMFIESSFGDEPYVGRNLVYFWDFNNEFSFESDRKVNADAFLQGKVKWIPPDFSFNKTAILKMMIEDGFGELNWEELKVHLNKITSESVDATI